MYWKQILASASLILVAGCASGRLPEPHPSISRVPDLAAQGVPVSGDLFNREQSYQIGPFDVLRYSVFGIEGMEGEIQVDAGGRIAIPLAGSVDAAGRTSEQLADDIAAKLRAAYVRDPKVTVNLYKMQSQMVTVDGEVEQPGLYPIVNDMTLTRAIASARGLSERGSQRNVVILRKIEGKQYLALFNLRDIRQGAYPDPKVYANDVVIVDNSRGHQLLRDFVQILPSFAGPLYLLIDGN